MPQVVLRLRPQPGFGATAEPLCEADRHVGADGRAAIDDPRQRHPGYAKLIRCLGDGQAKIGQHVFTDNQARVRRIKHLHRHFLSGSPDSQQVRHLRQ